MGRFSLTSLPICFFLWSCAGEHTHNDCLVGDLRTDDCRFGTFVVDTDRNLPVNEAVQFSLSFSNNWTDTRDPTVIAQQDVTAHIQNGTLRYFYTKLTDRPHSKPIEDVVVSIQLDSRQKPIKLRSCPVAADLSDVDSRKWESCHMVLESQRYVALRVYVPEGEVGAARDCGSCSTSRVQMSIQYSMAQGVCSADIQSDVATNETVEGRSYVYFMRDWDVFPDPFIYYFQWPHDSFVTGAQFTKDPQPLFDSEGGTATRVRIVMHSEEDIRSMEYLSWQPTAFYGRCKYGSIEEEKVQSVFLSLFIVSLVIFGCMVVLLAWSKYASWQWYGGDFEWDVNSEEGDDVDSKEEVDKTDKQSKNIWKNRKRLSLNTLSLKNFIYSSSGDDVLGGTAPGAMDIGVSSARRRSSSRGNVMYDQNYSPAASVAVMNPILASTALQEQESIASFQPTLAPRKRADSFNWDLFNSTSYGRIGDSVSKIASETQLSEVGNSKGSSESIINPMLSNIP